jgi:threonine/homoserine/homoserine lactone efflux protein
MPEPRTLLLFVAAAALLVAIPGPNHLYIVARSLTQGRGAGLASAFGVEAGTLVHIAAAAAGVSALVASSAVAFDVVRYLGAAYLCVLGIRALRSPPPDLAAPGAAPTGSLRRVFADGLIVNLLNPKVAVFFLAFLPQFVDPSRGSAAAQIVVLGLVLTAIGLTSNVAYALAAAGLRRGLLRRPGALRRLPRVSGGIYLALGVAAAFAGQRPQR